MEFRPNMGVGPVVFGMTRAAVAAVLGTPDRTLRRSQFEMADVELFKRHGIVVGYDAQDAVALVDVSPECGFRYDGLALFSVSARELCDWLRERDSELEVNPSEGCYSPKLGLFMSAYFDDGEDDPAMSFSVFRPHFREELRAYGRKMRGLS